MAQNQIATQSDLLSFGKGGDDRAMQSKFYNEMQNLRNESVPQRLASRGQNTDQLRKERNDLQEENRKLVNLVSIPFFKFTLFPYCQVICLTICS